MTVRKPGHYTPTQDAGRRNGGAHGLFPAALSQERIASVRRPAGIR